MIVVAETSKLFRVGPYEHVPILYELDTFLSCHK
jgi:hypothetical protein